MAGKTWIQSTPPPAGATYEWAGAPNASQSIKRVDGVWAARNWIIEPVVSVTTLTNWGRTSTVSWEAAPGGRRVWAHSDTPKANQMISWSSTAEPIALRGNTARMFATVTVPEGAPRPVVLRLALNLIYADGTSTSWTRGPEEVIAPGETRQLAHSVVSTTNVSHITLGIIAGIDRTFDTGDEFILHDGISLFAGAAPSGLVEFSGDTPDDRAGDTWLNPEEYKEYVWDSATKDWIPNPAAVSLSENLFVDPFFDQGMTHWTNGSQGGGNSTPTQGLAPGYGIPGHANAFSIGSYVTGTGNAAGPTPWMEGRPQAKQGDVLQGVALVKRAPGGTVPSTAMIELRPWRNPGGVSTIGGSMANIRLADMPVDEWVELSGSWTLTEAGSYDAFARVYYSPYGPWPSVGDPAPSVLIGYMFTAVNPTPPKGGVTEVSVATTAREALVGDVLARSRQKIDLKLALPDRRLRGGERIDLAAAAASASEVSWRWRQVTGPTVTLRRRGNTCSFIAPDVTETTSIRIAVSAATQEGGLRSNWEFFDLEISPTHGRFAPEGLGVFSPHTPRMVGYSRGKRELWGDVLPPVGLDPQGRHDAKIVDIGFPADDVQVVADGAPPRRAPQGGVFIDLETGDVYQNFGEGYNEDEDTTGAPRRSAIMISPATGDVFQWIEGASDVG